MEELLGRSQRITFRPDAAPQQAAYPASGYSLLPLTIS
jgi:hypothetical protein